MNQSPIVSAIADALDELALYAETQEAEDARSILAVVEASA